MCCCALAVWVITCFEREIITIKPQRLVKKVTYLKTAVFQRFNKFRCLLINWLRTTLLNPRLVQTLVRDLVLKRLVLSKCRFQLNIFLMDFLVQLLDLWLELTGFFLLTEYFLLALKNLLSQMNFFLRILAHLLEKSLDLFLHWLHLNLHLLFVLDVHQWFLL